MFYMTASLFLIAAVSFGMMGGQVIYQGTNRTISFEIRSQDAETAAAIVSLVSLAVGMSKQQEKG
ncbi:MAG TPA: hypothetical protein DCE56_06595 [Cyanobacteria bacterium UBA8553]|nr:hypothetical protein [Cyanobacteria bacterium UBA8553]